jgi:hypothetical protein
MNHLIQLTDLHRIENSLLVRRDQIVSSAAFGFNMILLGLVLAGFGYFLYIQYNLTKEAQVFEEKRIPFTPTTWYSAVRNVRSEEYGRQLQPSETQTGSGVPEPFNG